MKKLLITAPLLLLLSLKPLFAGVAKGIDVREVQTLLTLMCFNPGPIDGAWGNKTEKAVEEFFTKYTLKYDGTFDDYELYHLQAFSRSSGQHVMGIKIERCPVTMSEKMASKNQKVLQKKLESSLKSKLKKRNTINPFLAWNSGKPINKYGLAWTANVGRSNKTITLNEVYWNYHYVGKSWSYYPGIEEFLTNRNWDHDAEYGKTLATKITDEKFQDFIVEVIKSKVSTSQSNGVILDWWHNSHGSSSGYSKHQVGMARNSIAKKLREALGPSGIILGNVNWRKDKKTVKYINGVFLELYKKPYNQSGKRLYNSGELREIENLLFYYEKNLQFPKLIALDGWRKTTANTTKDRNTPENRKMAKLLTAMSVTIPTNGYILYGDNNPDTPSGDHNHNYYDFYSFDIGKPTGGYEKLANGVGIKQHQKGFIAYNRNSRPHTLNLDNNVNLVIEGTSGLFCKKKSSGYDCLPPD